MHREDPPEKRRPDQGAETGRPGPGPPGPSLPVGVRDQSAEADRDRIETSATDQEGTGQGAEDERGQPAAQDRGAEAGEKERGVRQRKAVYKKGKRKKTVKSFRPKYRSNPHRKHWRRRKSQRLLLHQARLVRNMMKASVLKKRKKDKERDKQDKTMFIQKAGLWKSGRILK